MRALLCLLLSLAATPLIASHDAAPCPALTGLTLSCTSNQHGWFYAQDAGTASAIAADASQAFLTFERLFGVAPPRGAIIALDAGQVLPAELTKQLRESTGAWTMPWLSPEQRKLLAQKSIEKRIRESQPQMTDERVTALVASALQKTDAGSLEQGVLRHEIGHKLLIEAFWPHRDRAPRTANTVRYGGPGPDWLDETAAVLAETAEMQAHRRTFLVKEEASSKLLSLQDFFSSDHPMTPTLGQLTGNQSGSRVRIVTGEEASKLAGGAIWFYVQSLAVADFLLETSANPQLFASIAPALARGDNIADWLEQNGNAFRLPTSVDALDAAWWEWLRVRHGVIRPTGAETQSGKSG